MFGIRKMKQKLESLENRLNNDYNLNERKSSKTNHKVNELETATSKLIDQNKKLEDRIWLLENPPKYKVGQAVKGMIITSVEVMDYKTFIHLGNPEMNFYDLLNKNAQNRESNIFNRKAWQYKAIKKGMTEPIEIL